MGRSALLSTDTEDLKELLSNGKSYSVPPYQRDYSWQQEHWEDLWEDLLEIEKSPQDHYMGALVLEEGERKRYRIIDGQQRMTTLSILILACVDYLYTLSKEGGKAGQENEQRAGLLEAGFIGAKDPASLLVIPKLKLNGNDDVFFQWNIAQRKPPQGSKQNLRDSERLLWECFLFFQHKIEEKFSASRKGEDVALFVSDVVAERLIFISVRVQDQVSAYTVFETLNARGLELTETDLLKNYLLSLADQLSKSQMEPVLKQWSRITSRVGVARFPDFLRHHLNSRREYVRQKQLFKTIKRDISNMREVVDLLDRLEGDAAWFEALSDESNLFWNDFPGAKEHARVLKLFKVSQFTPLIFAAKDRFDKTGVTEILRYIAVVSVRFNGIGRRSTHVLEEAYNRIALAIRNGAITTLPAMRQALQPIYVPDDEFQADFRALRLRNHGTHRKRLQYILTKIEKQHSHLDITDEAMTATIEHILPENPATAGWEHFSPEAHERSCELLGNYALLESKPNRDIGNAAFDVKRQAYQSSQYHTSREIAQFEEWTEEAIIRRQAAMAKVAKSIWALAL